jgi:hypothetical protein
MAAKTALRKSCCVADIQRRFARSLANLLNLFSFEVNTCHCLMNTYNSPELVFVQSGHDRSIIHRAHYQDLQKAISE